MFKRIIAIILVGIIFCLPLSAEEIKQPKITSNAYVLYNPKTNEVMESKNADVKMYPASLTKMLTALVSYELCENLEDVITVSENAVKSIYGTGSSKAYIKIGEQISVKQMLYLMMLPSGNDAANALAEHFCGSNQAFAKEMNKKAKELGMKNSHFVNPHGLHDNNHYTTAADLALLADAYCQVEVLRNVATSKEFFMPATNKQPERIINTTNFMMVEKSGYYYEYAKGLKTGYTDDAGHCLVANARKGEIEYICVLLDCPEVWQGKGYIRSEFLEAAKIFEYAFETYETVKIADKGTKVGENKVFETFDKTVDIVLKDDVFATLKKGTDLSDLKINYKLDNVNEDKLLLPTISSGDKLGVAKLYLNGVYLGKTDVLANNTVKAHWWLKFWHAIDLYVFIVVAAILLILLLAVALLIRKYVILYKRAKRKRQRLERRRRLQAEFDLKPEYDYFKMN